MIDFYSAHNHSDASNIRGYRDSICTVRSLIERALELGYSGLSITDHECLSNSIEAINYYYKHLKDTDFKIGIGNEIYLIDDIEETKNNSGKYYHFLLQAKDEIGFELLRRLSSKAWENYYVKGIERTPITKEEVVEIIGSNKGHLIASTACLGGEFANLVLKYLETKEDKDKLNIHKFLCWCVDIFGRDFYIELAPSLDPEQIEFNKMAIHIAKAYKLPFILATDSHMLSKEDLPIHSAFINANDNGNDNERDSFYQYSYMMSYEEMKEYSMSSMSEGDFNIAMSNTMEIYNKIQMYDPSKDIVVPEMDLPTFEVKHIFHMYYGKYEFLNKFANSEYEQDKYLLYLVEEGFIEKKQDFNEENIARIDIEMKELWLVSEGLKQRMSSYYNLTQFIVEEVMWRRAESIVGIARGSVTGFYVAYLMNITAMNPIPHNLPHWRHLHHSKYSMADIDIDTSALKRPKILEETQKAFGIDNVLNIATFKREGSKSAIQTAMRGLGYSSDDAQFLSSLIPTERGKTWSIGECLHGDGEEKEAITEFKNELKKYNNVKEVAMGIESLIVGRSIHASGVLIYKNGYINNGNSLMKAPNGQRISAFDMNISEQIGNLKLDYLTTEATDLIQTCIELLAKNNVIEWQGHIKETYNKYLHPDVLDYGTSEMFDMLGKGEVLSVFQFSTDIGMSSAKKIKPRNLNELCIANSIMRLAGEKGEESPLDKFIRYRNDINEWYMDMHEYGLSKEEVTILEEHLLSQYGVCNTQEDIMEMVQNPRISNFTMTEADKFRKAIGKKNADLLEQTRMNFFEKGFESGCREIFLNYIWFIQFKMSFGYAFSRNHVAPYSTIGLQELNLAYHYPIQYWNCAVLAVNSGALELDEEKNKGKDYGKLANALGDMKAHNVEVKLPDINKSDFTFAVDKDTNNILFGLKGISKINDGNCIDIMNNRPYKSLEDFCEKMSNKLETGRIVSLIKAGCFDELENKNRVDIMKNFIDMITDKKTSLTATSLPNLIDLKLTPVEFLLEARFVKFRKHIFDKQFFAKNDDKTKSKKYYRLDNKFSEPFFVKHFIDELEEDKDYIYDDNGNILVLDKNFDKIYKQKTQNIHEWLKEDSTINTVNGLAFKDNWDKYVKSNSVAKWEMESVSFYYGEHELTEAKVNLDAYLVEDFNTMPEVPAVVGEKTRGDRTFYEYKTSVICGTVIHRDKGKHIVSLLTPNGVVKVKFYKGAFNHYDKTLSKINSDGTKTRVESGWFTRGTQLLIKGYRQGDQFRPKTYDFSHTVFKIEGYQDNGMVWLVDERAKIE